MEFKGLISRHKTPRLTPLIDIVFLLLVFFMLTSHFIKDQSLDIALPEANSADNLKTQGELEIVINSNGEILIANQIIKPELLNSALTRSLQARANKRVILRADKHTQLSLTVQVMDAARSAGAESLDILTSQP